jgi:hypothetical protein
MPYIISSRTREGRKDTRFMNHSDVLPNKSGKMRYFTPELFLRLNSSDSEAVDAAVARWDKATASYAKSLSRLRGRLPAQARSLAKLSLHDSDLLNAKNLQDGRALIVLRQNEKLVMLWYSLSDKLRVFSAPQNWSLSKERVHWLYDELDANEDDPTTFVHRILLSDGTTLEVPFSDCRVLSVTPDHAMSHSEVMQIA